MADNQPTDSKCKDTEARNPMRSPSKATTIPISDDIAPITGEGAKDYRSLEECCGWQAVQSLSLAHSSTRRTREQMNKIITRLQLDAATKDIIDKPSNMNEVRAYTQQRSNEALAATDRFMNESPKDMFSRLKGRILRELADQEQ